MGSLRDWLKNWLYRRGPSAMRSSPGTIVYDDFPAEVFAEVSIASNAIAGQGFFIEKLRMLPLRVEDKTLLEYSISRMWIRPVTTGLTHRKIEYYYAENEKAEQVLLGSVLLEVGITPPRVIHMQSHLNKNLTSRQQALDTRLSRAIIAVMNYIHQQKEAHHEEKDRFRRMWNQYGWTIEKQEMLEIVMVDYEEEISVTYTPFYTNFTAITGHHTGYYVSNEFQVLREIGGR